MEGNLYSTKAMFAGVIPPLLHRNERRPPVADADLHLHVQGAPELVYPIPIVAPATATRSVRLVDFLRPDLKNISLPPGISTLTTFVAARNPEVEEENEALEHSNNAGLPPVAPLSK